MEKGFLVASDANQEWLLPWWWERYSRYNNWPVGFVDLGMSEAGRLWCRERGTLLVFEEGIKAVKKTGLDDWKISKSLRGDAWIPPNYEYCLKSRPMWFQKPAACLLTPFQQTVWMDLDCEILGNLDELFDLLEEGIEMALTKETQDTFNSSVMLFRKNCFLLKEWVDSVDRDAQFCWGDECLLSGLIHKYPDKVKVLPDIYNWCFYSGVPFYPKVVHWCGASGKKTIAEGGSFKRFFEECFKGVDPEKL